MPSYTALVVVLYTPKNALAEQRYGALQVIRRTHDAAFRRWRPHLTLIPPFHIRSDEPASAQPPPWLAQALRALTHDLRRVCSEHDAHDLQLSQIGSFKLRRYQNIHLRPSTATSAPLMALQAALADAAAPHLPTSRRQHERFVAHSSLGQAHSKTQRATLVDEASTHLGAVPLNATPDEDSGLLARIDRIQVMYKPTEHRGPYTLWEEVPLR